MKIGKDNTSYQLVATEIQFQINWSPVWANTLLQCSENTRSEIVNSEFVVLKCSHACTAELVDLQSTPYNLKSASVPNAVGKSQILTCIILYYSEKNTALFYTKQHRRLLRLFKIWQSLNGYKKLRGTSCLLSILKPFPTSLQLWGEILLPSS